MSTIVLLFNPLVSITQELWILKLTKQEKKFQTWVDFLLAVREYRATMGRAVIGWEAPRDHAHVTHWCPMGMVTCCSQPITTHPIVGPKPSTPFNSWIANLQCKYCQCCHWATANQSSPHRGPSSFVGDLNFLNALHELHFLFVFRDWITVEILQMI